MTVKEVLIKYGFSVDTKSKKEAEDSTDKLVKKAGNLLGTLVKIQTVIKAIKLADKANQIANEVQFMTRNLEDAAQAEEILSKAANNTATSYESMVDTTKTLLNSQSALFKNTQDAADYAELMTKAFRGTGMEAQQAAAYSKTLAQSFVTGKVSAGAISSMMTEAPQMLEYLADEMGTTTQAVKAIGMAGQITARQMYEAISHHADEIEDTYSKLNITVKEASQIASNKLLLAWKDLNNEMGFTQTVAQAIVKASTVLANLMNAIRDRVKSLKEDMGGLSKLVTPLSGILAGGKIAKLLGLAVPHIRLIAAAIAIVVKNLFEILSKDGEFKDLATGTLGKLADILQRILAPILRILDAIGKIVASPIAAFLKSVLSLVSALLDALEPIIEIITGIIEAIAWVAEGIGGIFTGDFGELTADIHKTIEANGNTKAATAAVSNNTSTKTTNITNNFTNTFNGTDREIQRAQAKTAESNADNIIRATSTALAYGG